MKKSILLLVFTIVMSSSLFAQKNMDSKIDTKVTTYIERVESKITLTDQEKETLIALITKHAKASLELNKVYEKGSEELKAERKENNKRYSRSLRDTFGAERAKEIKIASRKNKGKGKKKKN